MPVNVPIYEFDTDFTLKVRQVIRVVQSDIGREYLCHAKFDGQAWDLTGFTGTVLGVKPDGNATDTVATIDEDTFKFTLTEQMAAVAGAYEIFLTVESGTDVKIQAPVLLCVLEGADGVISESALGALTELLQASQEALAETSQYATAAATSAEEAEDAADRAESAADSILVDVTDRTPYKLRPSGGGVDIGSREYDTIVGGTVAWNQKIQNGNFANGTTNWGTTSDNTIEASDGVLTLTPGRKYAQLTQPMSGWVEGHAILMSFQIKSTIATPFRAYSGAVWSGFTKDVPADTWTTLAGVNRVASTAAASAIYLQNNYNATSGWGVQQIKNVQMFDLTAMFGSTIADYIYSLEQATAGAGVAWFKNLFPEDYYEYNAGELLSVSGVSAHVMRDAEDNIIGNYPLDDSLTLRGIPKLDGGKLYYDGDTYESDGTVTKKYGIRDYESGDATDGSTMITDGTYTVYKLTTPTTATADPFTNPQVVDQNGTEEYVTDSIVPVGHDTRYRVNLLDNLNQILKAPTADGTYTMKVTVSNGEATYFWD